jgi:hypothetical protein
VKPSNFPHHGSGAHFLSRVAPLEDLVQKVRRNQVCSCKILLELPVRYFSVKASLVNIESAQFSQGAK